MEQQTSHKNLKPETERDIYIPETIHLINQL